MKGSFLHVYDFLKGLATPEATEITRFTIDLAQKQQTNRHSKTLKRIEPLPANQVPQTYHEQNKYINTKKHEKKQRQ